MDYDIIATLGPSSDQATIWTQMVSAGVTAFRLNTSHLSLAQLSNWLERLRPFLAARPAFPLVLDLQGSKWRLGEFTACQLTAGQPVELVLAERSDRPGVLPVPHADFFTAAPSASGEVVLNDAKVRLQVEHVGADGPGHLTARVALGGPISAHKGITFTASDFRIETISAKDRAIIEQTSSLGTVRYAISYLKDAAEMARYRMLLGPSAYLIAKLERRPAVDEPARVAETADELWLCRGDLGAEVGLAAMAEISQRFLAVPGKPTYMAGQVLEHMVDSPTPTRSEVCYLYDTLLKGYQGFVLSDEAAVGRFPVEACRTAALFKA